MLLKQSGEVLANEGPDIEKGDHNGEHTEKAEGHLRRGRAVAVSSRAHSGTAEGLAPQGHSCGTQTHNTQLLDFKDLGKIQSKKKEEEIRLFYGHQRGYQKEKYEAFTLDI